MYSARWQKSKSESWWSKAEAQCFVCLCNVYQQRVYPSCNGLQPFHSLNFTILYLLTYLQFVSYIQVSCTGANIYRRQIFVLVSGECKYTRVKPASGRVQIILLKGQEYARISISRKESDLSDILTHDE